MLVREYPPLALHTTVRAPNGKTFRWAGDEWSPTNVAGSMSFSSTMPGGDEAYSCTLPRRPDLEYEDLAEFSELVVRNVGGEPYWQGRLEGSPRTSGDQVSISPAGVGYQALLTDRNDAREIYIDIDQSRWQGPSITEQLRVAASGWSLGESGVSPDPNGIPGVELALTGAWTVKRVAEMFYDALGMPLSRLYAGWRQNGTINPAFTDWWWKTLLMEDDVWTGWVESAQLRAVGPGTVSLNATTNTQRWAALVLSYANVGGVDGGKHAVWFTPTVFGLTGVPSYSTGAASGAVGEYGVRASDVIAHMVAKYAPGLKLSRGGASTIEPSVFPIPQLAFFDLTNAGEMLKQTVRFELQDWWVDHGPTFHLASPGNHGRHYRARVGPSNFVLAGPSVDKIWNGVVVQWTDVTGATRTVGPPGSGCNYEDANLYDSSPENPATIAGLTRTSPPLQMGTSTLAGGVQLGKIFLQQQRLVGTGGTATITAIIEDDHGVIWPAARIAAGDWIRFTDAHDTTEYQIVSASYDDSTKVSSIAVGAAPDGLQALLERLGVSTPS